MRRWMSHKKSYSCSLSLFTAKQLQLVILVKTRGKNSLRNIFFFPDSFIFFPLVSCNSLSLSLTTGSPFQEERRWEEKESLYRHHNLWNLSQGKTEREEDGKTRNKNTFHRESQWTTKIYQRRRRWRKLQDQHILETFSKEQAEKSYIVTG